MKYASQYQRQKGLGEPQTLFDKHFVFKHIDTFTGLCCFKVSVCFNQTVLENIVVLTLIKRQKACVVLPYPYNPITSSLPIVRFLARCNGKSSV